MGTSRQVLLQWVNNVLDASYSRVEDLSDAVAYCQLMDALYPRCGVLNKTKIPAKNMFETKNNFMCLQAAFDKMKVGKIVPIDRLMRAKFQDNYEFLHWFKKFYDIKINTSNRDESLPRRAPLPWSKRISDGHFVPPLDLHATLPAFKLKSLTTASTATPSPNALFRPPRPTSVFMSATNSPRPSPRPPSGRGSICTTPRTKARSMSVTRACFNRGSPQPTPFTPQIRSRSFCGSPRGPESLSDHEYFRADYIKKKSTSICDLARAEFLTPKKSSDCTSIFGHSSFASTLPRIAPIAREPIPVHSKKKRANSFCGSPRFPGYSGIDSESNPRSPRRTKSLAPRRRSRSVSCRRKTELSPTRYGKSNARLSRRRSSSFSNVSRSCLNSIPMKLNSSCSSNDSFPKPENNASDSDSSTCLEDLPKITVSDYSESVSESSLNGDESDGTDDVLHLDEVVRAASTLLTWRQAEKNFYYNKLRRIEILCKGLDQDHPLVHQFFKIMYATHDLTTTAKFS